MTRYDESRPEVWKVPLRDQVQPKLEVLLPKAGYWVPAAYAPRVAGKLALHGIRYQRIEAAQPGRRSTLFAPKRSNWPPKTSKVMCSRP